MGTPSLKISDNAGNIAQILTSSPAGTESGLVVRIIPSGTQSISGTITANLGSAIPTGTNSIGTVGLNAGSNIIGSVRLTDGTNSASVRSVGTNPSLNVAVVDASGNQITNFSGSGSATTTILGPTVTGNTPVNVFGAGEMRVIMESVQLFYDGFDTGSLDITNKWKTQVSGVGGVAALNTTSGNTQVGSGTTANGYSYLESNPSFPSPRPSWLQIVSVVNIEFPIITNTYRFWGLGTSPATPTAAAPLTDAVGFELSTAGKLYAVTYASGTRNQIADLSSTGNSKQPLDANAHSYGFYFSAEKTYWTIDGIDAVVATNSNSALGPSVNNLPYKITSIAGATAPSSNANVTLSAAIVADTGRNTKQISDATYPWRKMQVSSIGAIRTQLYDAVGNPLSTTQVGIGGSAPKALNVAVLQNTDTQIDQGSFSAGFSTFTPSGSIFNDSLAANTSGMVGVTRATAYRADHVNLRTSANTEMGFDASTNSLNVALIGQTTGAPVIGNITAAQPLPGTVVAGGTITANVGSAGNCTITIKGTFNAQFFFEISDDSGTTWYPTTGARTDNTASENTTPVLTTPTGWNFAMPGFNQIRIRCITYTSGTVVVRIAQGGFLYSPSVSGNVDINGSLKATYHAVAKRTSNTFTAGSVKQMVTFHHIATTLKTVKFRKITIGIDTNSVAGVVTVDIVRISTAPTGTAFTPMPSDSSDPAATTLASALITFSGSENPSVIYTSTFNIGITASTFPPTDQIVIYNWVAGSEQKPISLRPGILEGIAVKLTHSAASALTFNATVIFTEE